MPEKLNKGGKPQPYVPAGNGDASGEYADNESGSNKHFTNFKKVEEPPKPQPKKKTKEETRYSDLSLKQKHEMGDLIPRFLDRYSSSEKIIEKMRYYTGNFGDLSNFSDDELKDLIQLFKDAKGNETGEEYYYKKGAKWETTNKPGLATLSGYKPMTKEDYEKTIAETNQKLVSGSQTKQDKQIQELYNKGNCIVCFGKGYSDNDLNEIYKTQKKMVEEFPELNGFINRMGDRTNLEKYINAVNETKPLSEEKIKNEMNRINSMYPNKLSDEVLREKAIKNLRSEVKIQAARNAYAYWDSYNKSMIYMPVMKKVTQKQRDYEFNSNFKSSNHPQHTAFHEMGHAVDYLREELANKIINNPTISYQKKIEVNQATRNFESNLQDLISQNYSSEYKTKYDEYTKQGLNDVERTLAKQGIKEFNISRYGNKNDKEFVAECFGAYYTGMNNPLANKTVELFKNYMNELRKYL